jgi:predicted O-linked N-acetylglucosamine transferase (SPINDLY family)/2-polyprenyl-3-methyl-5-hydroxy-6-metoxy-1,4-benzoquinol methylase
MTTQAEQLDRLLEQINSGDAAETLPELDQWLRQQPDHPLALTLRAEALRLAERPAEAIEAYRLAGSKGGGARNWLLAGILLAGERKTDEAVKCLLSALTVSPDDEQALDTLITTLYNNNRQWEAIEFARRQLAVSHNPKFLANAALLLHTTDFYEEACTALKRILQLAPDDPAIVGTALGPARFTCEWEWIELLQRTIGTWYDAGNFVAPQEFPLTHLTWCTDEARNLGVTRGYFERTVGVKPHMTRAPNTPEQRFRVGYLSCDFRNHATMHLMAGLFECHDRERFEVFAYDYSTQDISDYRQRFLDAVEHHVDIHSLSDKQAAERIAQDRLDILFDLKVYTGGGRVGILAYRPAPLQVAYLGFPGSAANPFTDYIVSDRFVTPDSSSPYYTEKFCRLPHTYQCNDRKRQRASAPGTRAMHGLPDDKVVFGAFNQSYKIDRGSFTVWLRILTEVPDSVLWLLGQNQAAISNLARHAQSAGIGPERLIFAPFADPRQHLARLQLADAILDTLVCNGHTTTSDALWAGIPVITARGRHFASRVSESLLNALGLPELVGVDYDDMVRIAKRIGTDAEYRAAVRDKTTRNRLTAPLFDTERFTRNFETAIEMMIQRHRSGGPHQHIDVADRGPVAPLVRASEAATGALALQETYLTCPLCEGASVTLGFANCGTHNLWHEPLPRTIEWMRCSSCGHVHNRRYWTQAGMAEVLRKTNANPLPESSGSLEAKRAAWASVANRVTGLLGGCVAIMKRATRPLWVDVGCGDGTLIMTAADYGFAAVGLDTRADAVARIQALGFTALQHEFLQLKFEVVPEVLSLMDVLEQIPHPRAALRKAAEILQPGGVLVVSTADLASSVWKAMDAEKSNPYWMELERHHIFGRERLVALLSSSDFEIVDFAIPNRSKALMEFYAVRK